MNHTRTRTMNREPKMSKKARREAALARKRGLWAKLRTIGDLARSAGVSYSMAEKWANARRESAKCQRAWERLTRSVA